METKISETKEKHTPGPWTVGFGGQEGDGFFTITSPHRNRAIAEATAFGDIPCSELDANASRIVACVNACEGIPTEALVDGAVKDLREAAKQARSLLLSKGPKRTSTDDIVLVALESAIAKATA